MPAVIWEYNHESLFCDYGCNMAATVQVDMFLMSKQMLTIINFLTFF